MIKSFKDEFTETVFEGEVVGGDFPSKVARRKLEMIHAAANLNDLRVPPGNRLEALKGTRSGQHSIRINDKYRVCFVWTEAGAEQVEIVDYH